MPGLAYFVSPTIWACSALSLLLSLMVATRRGRTLGVLGTLLLWIAAALLLFAIADPRMLPVGSAIVHPDGSTEDPRVLAAVLTAVAALAWLAPAWRRQPTTSAAAIGQLVPGLVAAVLFGVLASFIGLRQPMALVGVSLGAFGVGTAVKLWWRGPRERRESAQLVQSIATLALAVAAVLTVHGARATGIRVAEGGVIDTLGHRVRFTASDAAVTGRHALDFVVVRGRDSINARAELRGAAGRELQSVAAGGWFSGPLLVPISLEERRPTPHDIEWVDRLSPLVSRGATIRLLGFRFVRADTIRLYTDLEVTTKVGVTTISPGMYATPNGEIPFAAEAPGFGPIAVARIDADHGRAGLILPQLSESEVTRIASVDLRLRPALPVAWVATFLALLAFLGGAIAEATAKPEY